MKWVTWEQVGVDRMACAWLITTYIDHEAEFLFVPSGQQPLPEGAEPFDIPGVRLSHHRGHCTFYTMVREYDLRDPVLQRIARVVDEADTVQDVMLEPCAVSPGDVSVYRLVRRLPASARRHALRTGTGVAHPGVVYRQCGHDLTRTKENSHGK
jgi:hypothetical protein